MLITSLIAEAERYSGADDGYPASLPPAPEPPVIAPVLTVRQPVLKEDVTSALGATTVPEDRIGIFPNELGFAPGRVPGPQPIAATTVEETRYGPAPATSAQLVTLTYAPNILGKRLAPTIAIPTDTLSFPGAIIEPEPLHVPKGQPINGEVEAPPSAARRFPWWPFGLGALALVAL